MLPRHSHAQSGDLTAALRQAVASVNDGGMTSRFYQRRNYLSAWSGHNGEAAVRQALVAIGRAADEGLDPERYRATLPSNPVARDVALTASLLKYMNELSVGRGDLRVDADVALPARSFDAAAALEQALQQGSLSALLAGLAPSHPGYTFLRNALARQAEGSVRDTLIANMERWRWMPREIEPNRIQVNVADAQLQLWLGDRPVLTSRVIVGRPRSRTPILRAEGAGITVNPPWTVPHSIAAKEILPKLKANAAYLASQDMVLLDGPADDPHGLHINWRAIPAGSFPYRIQQRPGPRNSLGLIKIELPNRFNVYLHDTPGKAAFARANRAVSHGCVRVEQILPLASYALSTDPSTTEKITQAIDEGKTKYLPLSRKLPVYFLYWTAFAGLDGQLEIRKDIYGRDQRLIGSLRGRPFQIAGDLVACQKA